MRTDDAIISLVAGAKFVSADRTTPELLEAVRRSTVLTHLDLRCDVVELLALLEHPSLVSLSVMRCVVTDAEVPCLARLLRENVRIKEIWIPKERLTASGIRELVDESRLGLTMIFYHPDARTKPIYWGGGGGRYGDHPAVIVGLTRREVDLTTLTRERKRQTLESAAPRRSERIAKRLRS